VSATRTVATYRNGCLSGGGYLSNPISPATIVP